MTNVNRHRTGSLRQAQAPVDSASVIEVGDALYYDGNDVKPASDVGWDTGEEATTEALCRRYFAARFGGVALDASASGDTKNIRTGSGPEAEFEFPCESAAYEIGDLFGPAGVDTPKNLADQSLLKVNDPREAAFIATRRAGSATTTVWVRALTGAEREALMATVQRVFIGEADLTATGSLTTDFNFGKRVRILELEARVTTLLACDQTAPVVSLTKDTTELDDTLTFAEGDAVGAIKSQAIDDATGDDVFEAEDDLDVKVKTAAADSGTAAGVADITLVVCDLPANK